VIGELNLTAFGELVYFRIVKERPQLRSVNHTIAVVESGLLADRAYWIGVQFQALEPTGSFA
jgi:hypothetical protein